MVDARDVLEHPAATLRALCGALGVEFDPAMLSWPRGPRDTDGVWGRYWYDAVWNSTGFAAYRGPADSVPPHLRPLLDDCQPYYESMAAHRLADEEHA